MRGSYTWSAWLIRLIRRVSETVPVIEPRKSNMFLPKILELETFDKKRRLVKIMFIKQ